MPARNNQTSTKPAQKARGRVGLIPQNWRLNSYALIAFVLVFVAGGGYLLRNYLLAASGPQLVEIQSQYIGHCLQDHNDSSAIGARIDIYDCNGSQAESWYRYSSDYSLRTHGLCLTATNRGQSGSLVELDRCVVTPEQQWYLSNGNLRMAGTDQCVTSPNFNYANGTDQRMYNCHYPTTKNQVWHLAGCSTAQTCGYDNPLRSLSYLKPERVDQGVDYAATGIVRAVGAGHIVQIIPPATAGWDGGWWISEQLLDGRARGRYVYVAEGCTPLASLKVGEDVTTATGLCKMNSSAIETGWAAPPSYGDEAMALGQAGSTAFGNNYNLLLGAVGARKGYLTGSIVGSLPAGWPTW